MAFIGTGSEYALHTLLWLRESPAKAPSNRDLAELQGISVTFLAKILPKLERAGLVTASEGRHGGYRLARPADRISVLAVVQAIEGKKAFFNCQEMRVRCALFQGKPPIWATRGVCSIHAVMLRAERAMLDDLADTTLADLEGAVYRKAPAQFSIQAQAWLSNGAINRKKPHKTSSTSAKRRA